MADPRCRYGGPSLSRTQTALLARCETADAGDAVDAADAVFSHIAKIRFTTAAIIV